MANQTASTAASIHGTNPQYLVGKVFRQHIYDSLYWKEECFGLTVTGVMEKSTKLTHIGGSFGMHSQPIPFICLALKLLQLQPDHDMVLALIEQDDFKYMRALAAFYFRLTATSSADIYQQLEPLYRDYRKLRRREEDGSYSLSFMDEFVDDLLRESFMFHITLPHLAKRLVLEDSGELAPRLSPLDDDSDSNTDSG